MTTGFRDVSFTFVSRVAVLAIALGNQSCLAWLLGPAGRGSYAVSLLFMTLLSLAFTFGCHIALQIFVASKKFTLSEGITYALICGGAGSGLSIFVGLILLQLPLSFFEKAPAESFHLAMMLMPLFFLSTLLKGFLISMREFGWFAAFSVGSASLQFVLIFTLLKGLEWGVNGALLACILTATITILAILFFYRSRYGICLARPSVKKLIEMFSFGSRYYIGNMSNQLNVQLGTILLALVASPVEIGLFAVASLLVTQVEMVPDSLGAALMPRVVVDEKGRCDLVAQCARLSAIACGFFLLVLVIFADTIVPIVFSGAFLPMVPLVRIISVGVFVRCCSKIFVPYLMGMNHPGVASFAVAGGVVTNMLGLWLLLPVLGLPGAAMAMTAGYLVSSAILMISFARLSALGLRGTWMFNQRDWKALIGLFPKAWRGMPFVWKNVE